MAKRGSKKQLSVEQEDYVAAQYGGKRSASSGASVTDQGDVRVLSSDTLFECKGKFGERTGEKPVRSTLLKEFEKIADEAWAEGKDPAMALRFYKPDSILADSKGYVDLTVRLLADDAFLMDTYRTTNELVEIHKQTSCTCGDRCPEAK